MNELISNYSEITHDFKRVVLQCFLPNKSFKKKVDLQYLIQKKLLYFVTKLDTNIRNDGAYTGDKRMCVSDSVCNCD